MAIADNPNGEFPHATPYSIAVFLIALADGLLDLEQVGIDPERWVDAISQQREDESRQIPRLTEDDVRSLVKLFDGLRGALEMRRRHL